MPDRPGTWERREGALRSSGTQHTKGPTAEGAGCGKWWHLPGKSGVRKAGCTDVCPFAPVTSTVQVPAFQSH